MRKFIVILVLLWFWPQLSLAAPSYIYADYRTLLGRQAGLGPHSQGGLPQLGIISHHLPVASPLLDHFYGELKQRRPDIKTFVVIGPDHFERCRQKFVTTADQAVQTMFGELTVDQTLSSELLAAGIRPESDCFYGEHAIGVEANYIRKFFPKAKIVPVLLSYAAHSRDFRPAVEVLAKKRSDVFVLASLDFTHYVDAHQAAANDQLSLHWLKALNGSAFTLKQVDSPGTLRLLLGLARAIKRRPQILEHKNSYDYTGMFNNTTSYFSVFF